MKRCFMTVLSFACGLQICLAPPPASAVEYSAYEYTPQAATVEVDWDALEMPEEKSRYTRPHPPSQKVELTEIIHLKPPAPKEPVPPQATPKQAPAPAPQAVPVPAGTVAKAAPPPQNSNPLKRFLSKMTGYGRAEDVPPSPAPKSFAEIKEPAAAPVAPATDPVRQLRDVEVEAIAAIPAAAAPAPQAAPEPLAVRQPRNRAHIEELLDKALKSHTMPSGGTENSASLTPPPPSLPPPPTPLHAPASMPVATPAPAPIPAPVVYAPAPVAVAPAPPKKSLPEKKPDASANITAPLEPAPAMPVVQIPVEPKPAPAEAKAVIAEIPAVSPPPDDKLSEITAVDIVKPMEAKPAVYPAEPPPATKMSGYHRAPAAAVPTLAGMSVSFAKAASDLSPEAIATLDALAAQLQAMPDMRIQIRAYAESEDGNASTARRLSLSRALMVRSHLTDKGIKPARLDVRALGSETDKAPTDRADIVFVK